MKRFEQPLVVLAHGLWLSPAFMLLLSRRLRREGFATRCFGYPSLRKDLPTNVRRLEAFMKELDAPEIHFIGHSLGGLLIDNFLAETGWKKPGRVVALGTPFVSPWCAKRLAGGLLSLPVLGASKGALLKDHQEKWKYPQELGIVAGNLDFGAGMILGQLPRPHDGTVSVAETMRPGAAGHMTVRVTHHGLLLSPTVAEQTAYFLKNGKFKAS